MILNENTRNVNYRRRGGSAIGDESRRYCGRNKSPSWKGARWYRFMAPAGTRIPEKLPSYSSDFDGVCATYHPGWLNGHHPKKAGEVVNRTVCFKSSGSGNCGGGRMSVRIRNCGSYFVYYLVNVPGCYRRYCAE